MVDVSFDASVDTRFCSVGIAWFSNSPPGILGDIGARKRRSSRATAV